MSIYTVWPKWYEEFAFSIARILEVEAETYEDAVSRCLIRIARDIPVDSGGVMFRVMDSAGDLRFFNYTQNENGVITEMLPEEHNYGEAS